MAVQGLEAPAGGTGLVPGQGSKMPQAMLCGQKKKKKEKRTPLLRPLKMWTKPWAKVGNFQLG